MNLTPLGPILQRHESTLQSMHNNAVAKSQLAARQVYNRESRNIARFIKQQMLFERKSREKPTMFGQKPQEKKKTRFGVTLRYDDNQTLELQYEPKVQNSERDISHDASAVASNNKIASSRETGFKTSKKSFGPSGVSGGFKFNLFPPMQNPKFKKAYSHASSNPMHKCKRNHSPELTHQRRQSIRRRVVTQFEQGSPREDSTFPTQPRRTDTYSSPTSIIVMSKQRMQRYIRNLHRVSWMSIYLKGKSADAETTDDFKEHMRHFQLDTDSAIPESNLNYMVARRYNLLSDYLEDYYDKRRKELDEKVSTAQKQKLADGSEYEYLDSLSNRSILTIINRKGKQQKYSSSKKTLVETEAHQQQEKEVHFSLPYSEFISERETRTSIYRLISMSTVTCLRIAFSLYDKNHNGKVDEDDLLQAISLSRKIPQLEPDILLIAEVMFNPRRNLSRIKRKAQPGEFVRSGGQKILLPHLINDMTSSVKFRGQDEEDQEYQERSGIASSTRFSLDKFYVFLKEKHIATKLPTPVNSETTVNSLTFSAFSRAFKGKRPAILYDMLAFLFGAQREDFSQQAKKEHISLNQDSKKCQRTEQAYQQTLEQKWNERLKSTNEILKNIVIRSQQL